MNNAWILTDLHLYTTDPDVRHPFRTTRKLGILGDNFSKDIDEGDVTIFLGDLCDPEAADYNKMAAVIGSIPGKKYMCRGNHDTQDDSYYLGLGFDAIADIIRVHNILFSHKPIRVAPDEINIHGHLHMEKMSGLSPNHINAYAANWNKDDHPVLLEDLLDSATVQQLDVSAKDWNHATEKFQKYTSYDDDYYEHILDLSEKINFIGYEEGTQIIADESAVPIVLYHGSPEKHKTLTVNAAQAYADKARVFATPSYSFALAFAGKPWSDLEVNQCVVDGKQVLTEILPGMFKEKFDCPGYVHVLEPDDFSRFGRDMEWVSEKDVDVSQVKRINNVLTALKRSDTELYEYPDLPPHIPDRKAYIEKILQKYNMNTTYDRLKSTYKLDESAIGEKKGFYHLSEKNLDGRTLTPRVPSNFLIDNGYEDATTKRVCLSPFIDNALVAMSDNLKDKEFYVHVPAERLAGFKHPTEKQVPDVRITKEIWALKPVKLKCIGKIHVTEANDIAGTYQYGDQKAELYSWCWEWVGEPVDESVSSNSTLQQICDFCDWMDKTFQYGALVNGKLKQDIDFDKEYIMQSPAQFEKSKIGVCWDYVSYEADYFKRHFPNVKIKTYYAQFFNEGECPSHTFLFFQLNGKWYYFENSFRMFAGVYELPSEESGINYVLKLMSDNPDPAIKKGELLKSYQYDVWEYDALDKTLFGLHCQPYMNYVMGNGKCWHHTYKTPGKVRKLSSKSLNESIGDIPRNYKPGYISMWQRDSDTLVDETLYQSADDVEYFWGDDNERKKKENHAKEASKSVVGVDETLDLVSLSTSLDENIRLLETALEKPTWPDIATTWSDTTNPNDQKSSKGVEIQFYDDDTEDHVGTACISGIDTDDGYLYDFEVFKKFRGKHYAHSMMYYILTHYTVTTLIVKPNNHAAIHLYEKFGFKKHGTYEEDGVKYLDMRRKKGKFVITESADTDPVDREEKAKLTKKYGIDNVGHAGGSEEIEQEEKELAEMKRRAAIKDKEKALQKKAKARNKQLKKARSAKKRKAFINKVKSILPGVKNEDASAVDNPEIDWFDSQMNESSTESEVSIQETYQFKLQDKVQFFDTVTETAKTFDKKLLPVYVVIMHTGTTLSTMIKTAIGSEFSHASISFDSSLSNMYSFARKLSDDGKASHSGGFRTEDIHSKFFRDREIKYAMYVVPCTEDQIKLMKKRLEYFKKNQSKFTYDFTGLIKSYFHISDNPEYRWFCTRFVADILNAGRPTDPYVQDPFLVRPDDFQETNFAYYVTSGYLNEYDQKAVDTTTKRILNTKKIQKAVQNEFASLPVDNPYERHILNYQMAMMDEDALNTFIQYIKSFKIRFDSEGNILITRREYDQLDAHFRESLRMIKTCESAGNVAGVKDELCKIHYMIELINQYYLKENVKNLRPNAKDVRKDMLDLRSVMMNAFKYHMKWVTTQEPNWNFMQYYDTSKYSRDLVVPAKLVTMVGKSIMTKL